MSIGNVGSALGVAPHHNIDFFKKQTPQASTDFMTMLGNSINETQSLMKQADRASELLATGQAENIHESMIAMEKADTALKLMVQVRNKALEAYNDILRMQV